jgi:hypothetical protein
VTVVVGYLAGKSGRAPLDLAVAAARTLTEGATPKRWR